MKITRSIIAAVLALLLTASLSSCLRDADEVPVFTETRPAVTDTEPEDTAEMEANTETEYVPPEAELSEEAMIWINSHPDADAVIMTADEIKAENLRVDGLSDVLTDILDFKSSHTGAELRDRISRDRRPALPAYDHDGSEITWEYYNAVIANMGEAALADEIPTRMGIVTSRANLRCLPDDKPYLKSADSLYDSLQETELHVGAPVWVLHQSVDGEYFYVRSHSYVGWVKAEDIAVTEDGELWRAFAAPEEFVVVTETAIFLRDEELDMGVKLPMTEYNNGVYTVKLPVRDEAGLLSFTEEAVPAHHVSDGYLPYTYKNFVTQAFKYEGVMYSWGGLDSGVDCSSFVSNVMRTFGFVLPRDTKDQESVVGATIDVIGKTHGAIAAVIESVTAPTAVYYKGHVLFYLGHNGGGEYSFIHAPQVGEAVSVVRKTDLSAMRYVCPFVKSE